MDKKCTKTPVTERVVGGKLAEKVVRRVGNCKKGGLRLLLVAKKVSQSVVKIVVTLVHRFQKGITPDTPFAIAERGNQVVSSCYKGTMTTHNFRRGDSCHNHPFCHIVLVHNILCNSYTRFTPLSATDVPPF